MPSEKIGRPYADADLEGPMPFESKKQERYMFARHPEIAKRWVAEQQAKGQPVVKAADLDLTRAIAARMGTAPQMTPEEYRASVKKHYADGDIFSKARAQLAAENSVPAPAVPAAPSPMPLALQATPATGATPYGLLGIDAADQHALDTLAHGMNQTIAAESKGGRYRPPTEQQKTPDLVFAQKPQPQAGGGGMGSLPAFGGGGGGTRGGEIPLMDPKRFAALQGAEDEQRRAQGAMGQAEAQGAQDAGQAAALRGDTLRGQQEDMQRKAAERDAELQRREEGIDKLSREVADKKMEPWDPSTGDRMRYALMGALGGFMQGYRGQAQNTGLQQVQREQDQFFAKQREEIERKKGRIGDMQGLLASSYRRFGNMEQAEAAARVVALQQLDADQQAQAATTNSAKAMAASKALSAQLKVQQDEQNARFFKYVPPGAGGGGLGDLRVRYQKYAEKWAEGEQKTPKMGFSDWVEQIGGGEHASTQFGPGAHGNPQVADQVAVMNQAVANVNNLRDEGGELPGTGIVSRNLPGNPATSGLRSSGARQVYGALWTVAESLAHANGQRGQEAIDANLKAIVGNGSQEDIDAGLRRAQAVVGARARAAGTPGAAAAEPEQTEDFTPGTP